MLLIFTCVQYSHSAWVLDGRSSILIPSANKRKEAAWKKNFICYIQFVTYCKSFVQLSLKNNTVKQLKWLATYIILL